jgi:hypothetical protein
LTAVLGFDKVVCRFIGRSLTKGGVAMLIVTITGMPEWAFEDSHGDNDVGRARKFTDRIKQVLLDAPSTSQQREEIAVFVPDTHIGSCYTGYVLLELKPEHVPANSSDQALTALARIIMEYASNATVIIRVLSGSAFSKQCVIRDVSQGSDKGR